MDFSLQAFRIPLLKIIRITTVLSGDNTVVIALAARSLLPRQFAGAGKSQEISR
jgi:predicted tellurium resistance membrane protein TerC